VICIVYVCVHGLKIRFGLGAPTISDDYRDVAADDYLNVRERIIQGDPRMSDECNGFFSRRITINDNHCTFTVHGNVGFFRLNECGGRASFRWAAHPTVYR